MGSEKDEGKICEKDCEIKNRYFAKYGNKKMNIGELGGLCEVQVFLQIK